MKAITMYQCEICNETYHSSDEAQRCESEGKETPLAKAGQNIRYKVKVGGGFDSFYVDMRVRKVEDHGHYIHYKFEEYDETDDEWYESDYAMVGVWGNVEFEDLCEVIN